ncbi:MAG: sulfite exporter TauE/SafE family protein [Bacteroidota bacterium]
MLDLLASFELSTAQWMLLAFCGAVVGMAKTGVAGVYNITVPILAIIFGGRDSTGILLPILLMADVFGVAYYNRSANWSYILKIFPWAFAGVVLGTWVGDSISDQWFNRLLAGVILLGIGIMLFMELRKNKTVPEHWSFAGLMGLLAGFTTMVGNAAGPIMAVFLLAMRLPKNSYIGTQAWFFMLINLCKLPFHVFVWKTISPASLVLDLSMLPAIAIGAGFGIWIVKHISEKTYRKFIIVVTILSTFLLFFR